MSVIEKLLVVQELDCRLRDIEQALKDIPARQQLEVSRLDEHKQSVHQGEERLKAAQADVHRIELEIETLRGKVMKLRQQQPELKTNKEFKAMETEIAGAEAEISKAEDRELVVMESVERARQELVVQHQDLKREEEAVQADVKQLTARAEELNRDLAKYRAERVIAASDVDANWLTHYDRVFQRRRDKALVPVDGGVCGGCHMKLTPTLSHASRRKDAVMVVCEFCGRLLYS